MNTEDIQIACMADLGRQRQDELPLSNRERKGPSFAPSRRNGTGHYAPALKIGLETKWNVEIDDEESEQMKGLSVEDSRPWAKTITQKYLNLYRQESAPPRIRQESRGHKRPKITNPKGVHVASLGGLVPPGSHVSLFNTTRPTAMQPPKQPSRSISQNCVGTGTHSGNDNGPQKTRSNSSSLVVPPTSSTAPPDKCSTEAPKSISVRLPNTPATIVVPIPESKPADPEQVVLHGMAKLLNPNDGSVLFIVTYFLKLRKDADEGYFILSAKNKADKFHNVLDLMAPDAREDICLVYSRSETNGFGYILQFPNASDAQKFKIYLESLQQAAAREAIVTEDEVNPTAMPVKATEKPQSLLAQSADDITPPSTSVASVLKSWTLPTPATPAPTTAMPDKVTATQGAIDSVQLVDVDSPPCDASGAKEFIIEDAAEMLVALINKILPEAAAAGIILSDDAIADIEETAIDDWLARGFLESETDDMKADLLDLFRILVRLKRKAESRKKKTQPAIRSLQNFDETESQSCRITYSASELAKLSSAQGDSTVLNVSRIQYTASEMEKIATTAIISCPDLDTNMFTQGRAQMIRSSQSTTMKNVAKHKDWLCGKPSEVPNPPESAKKTPLGLGASR